MLYTTQDGNEQLFLDKEYKLWLHSEKESTTKYITQLPSASPNRWQVNNNMLYFTSRTENIAFMHRINISNGEYQQVELAKNRLILDFDLSTSGNTLIGVKAVLAQSNLVRIQL